MWKFIFLSCACLFISNSISGTLIPFEDRWTETQNHVAKGRIAKYQVSSQFLHNRRDVWVYTPANYSRHVTPYPLLIVFDGQAYISQLIPTPIILDNLIAEGRIPPVVAIFVSSIDQSKRNRELPCYKPFANFVSDELQAWVHKYFNVTSDPQRTILAGSSFGGLAATYIAFKHPNQFGNVLSQSGAFWWKPQNTTRDQWLTTQIAKADKVPVRFYLDVGSEETDKYTNYDSMIEVNQKLRDTLQNKGYTVYYDEFKGDHEYESWRKTFSQGLIVLFGQKAP